MQANHQWSSRPADERFLSLTDLDGHFRARRAASRETIVASRKLTVTPAEDNIGLTLLGPNGGFASPTHWSFGQLAALAEAPAGYLRTMPSPIAADCINYGLQFKRQVEDVGLLLYRNGGVSASAVTGPRYGRIWNSDITAGLVQRFGNGLVGDFRIPGEFGHAVPVTRENTTLFGGDRDMFVFLADEANRVEIPDRRNGASGQLARGFFVWNSEVGAATLGIATFLFDYVCCNRIVWGATQYKQVTIRHTPKAPVRWLDEVMPALEQYHNAPTLGITQAIARAQATRIDAGSADVTEFLTKRFGKRLPAVLQDISMDEEGHPIETLWDATCAVTAYARTIQHQDTRVDLERQAGQLLDLVD
jgi:hypothetical protein